MSKKPSLAELEASPDWSEHEIKVRVFRRSSDGNLMFITDNGEVFDGHVMVVDSSGIPHVTSSKSGASKWGRRLLRGAITLFVSSKLGLPAVAADKLLAALGGQPERARAVLESAEMLADDPFAASMSIIHEFGPQEFASVVDEVEKFHPGSMDREEFLRKLRLIVSGK